MTTLVTWLGNTDLRAAEAKGPAEHGPILSAVKALRIDSVHILSDHPPAASRAYAKWLRREAGHSAVIHSVKLPSPTNYEAIYRAAVNAIDEIRRQSPDANLTYHLSPGTPAMAAVWLLLAKTRYPARLIESSREQGAKEVEVPFEVAAEFAPTLDDKADRTLAHLMQGLPPEAPAFTAIVHRCPAMKRIVAMARRLAVREVPVLLEGESGTGKELFARAIHQGSPRSDRPFVAVNCGAIPQELVDAELFGHEKGAFTGAGVARAGYFEAANGGTLFLDEVGELPLASQVRLLRVLQEGEVTRVGATRPTAIDVRIIAATNRVLPVEVQAGRFREDLFHRLAVGVLLLPPLRAREGDIGLLVDTLLAGINAEAASQPEYKHKMLDASARNIVLRYSWPGNVRELHNVLLRASIWATGTKITADDVSTAMAVTLPPKGEAILNRPLQQGLSLPELMADVARHYLNRAMAETRNNKSEAARLLGLGSYQTLTNWLEKYQPK